MSMKLRWQRRQRRTSPNVSHGNLACEKLSAFSSLCLSTDWQYVGSPLNSIKQIEPAKPIGDFSVPLVVAPLGFRQNSTFFGFQFELDQLHLKLSNKKKRSIGTCAVVVWGGPGCGKTHLVREYVWRHRSHYPGGIFWIDSKSEETIYKCFWEIGQAAALLGAAEEVRDGEREWDAASKFLDAVRGWLGSRDRWLLVFDGVSFDSEDEIQGFMKFLPDHRDNSIVFTSVDRTLAKRQRLLYPAGLKVSPLSVEDARRLLYNGLDIKKANPLQELKATQLVKYYECLPLAIHATSHMLNATGKALEKYHIGSYGTSKRLAEPYLEIMQDLWHNSHHEAIGLINLLSFYSHAVPVAMLELGRRALADSDVEIRSSEREGSTKRELDTTVATLIKYGLVERTLRSYTIDQVDSLRSRQSLATPELLPGKAEASQQTPTQEDGGESLQALIKAENGLESRNRASEPSTGKPEASQQKSIQEDFEKSSHTGTRPESSLGGTSNRSATYSIDVLRVHTVVQGFCRDELLLRDVARYYWWLTTAVKTFCLSYTNANKRIRLSEGQGLVRDYREYETHAARLHAHFPKKPEHLSSDVKRSRHELRKVMRAIKAEIEHRSPAHSFESIHHQVQISIFDRTSSSSSDGPDTPGSTPSRASTWALGPTDNLKSESPLNIESEDGWSEDRGYESDLDNSHRSSVVTERRLSFSEIPVASNNSESPLESEMPRRPSFLQAIFKGRPIKPKAHKDLGDWRPLPAPPSLSLADVKIIASHSPSKASSSDERSARPISAGSEAEAALAAVHRFSPPSSRGGRIRSSSRNQAMDIDPVARESSKYPLTKRSPNLQLSPLAAEFDPSRYGRTPTTATNYSSDLAGSPQPLSVVDNIMIPRRTPQTLVQATSFANYPTQSLHPSHFLPTGYTSTPMSRDASRESNHSLATAPAAVTASFSLGSPPPPLSSAQRPLPVQDHMSTSCSEVHRTGAWADLTSITALAPILSLDGSADRVSDIVQFGQSDPVNLAEARMRADEYASKLLPFDRGDYRPVRSQRAVQNVTAKGERPGDPGIETNDGRTSRQKEAIRGLGLHFQ